MFDLLNIKPKRQGSWQGLPSLVVNWYDFSATVHRTGLGKLLNVLIHPFPSRITTYLVKALEAWVKECSQRPSYSGSIAFLKDDEQSWFEKSWGTSLIASLSWTWRSEVLFKVFLVSSRRNHSGKATFPFFGYEWIRSPFQSHWCSVCIRCR